jgi:hypothetical protein
VAGFVAIPSHERKTPKRNGMGLTTDRIGHAIVRVRETPAVKPYD